MKRAAITPLFVALCLFATTVSAADPPPVAAAGALTWNGTVGCSGVLYGPDRIATAAHCVGASLSASSSAQFVTGSYPGNPSHSFPLVKSFRHPLYDPARVGVSPDIAVLSLAAPVDDTLAGPLPLGDPARQGETLFVAAWTADGPPRAQESPCPVQSASRDLAVLACRVRGGNSGAPVLRKTSSGLEIAAIVVASGTASDGRSPIAIAVQARSRIRQIEAVAGP